MLDLKDELYEKAKCSLRQYAIGSVC